MVDAATILPKPPTATAAPPTQPEAAPPISTFPLTEICDDELKAVLGIAHARAIASQGEVTQGTAAFLNAVADAFVARGDDLTETEEAETAWKDIATAIKGVADLVSYMELE